MLSFEVSAIDIILVLSVVILLIFYLTKLSGKTPGESNFRYPMGENEGPERQVSGFEGMKDNHILREYSWKPNSIENQFLERKTKDAPQDNNWNIEELLEITPNEKEADREGRVATERDPVVS